MSIWLCFFPPRLHVQSPTCSSRSSSTSVSCTRRCWWSSSNFPLIPRPLSPLVCIPLVAPPEALAPVNQPWTPSQAPTRLRALSIQCTPKSRHLRPMPTAPTLSVSPPQTSSLHVESSSFLLQPLHFFSHVEYAHMYCTHWMCPMKIFWQYVKTCSTH